MLYVRLPTCRLSFRLNISLYSDSVNVHMYTFQLDKGTHTTHQSKSVFDSLQNYQGRCVFCSRVVALRIQLPFYVWRRTARVVLRPIQNRYDHISESIHLPLGLALIQLLPFSKCRIAAHKLFLMLSVYSPYGCQGRVRANHEVPLATLIAVLTEQAQYSISVCLFVLLLGLNLASVNRHKNK